MRLRSAVGAGVLVVGLVAAIVVLRTPAPAPAGVTDSAPAPVIDARAERLTADFRHTTLLPGTVRFADDPHTPPGFVFRRFVDTEVNHNLVRYIAEGSLVRTQDNAVLDHVLVNVSHTDGRLVHAADLAACTQDGEYGGGSCTQARLPNGVLARVLRDPAFARTVASDTTTGSPPGLRSELDAAYPNGTLLTITLYSMDKAGIPLDDEAMLKLAAMPGIIGR